VPPIVSEKEWQQVYDGLAFGRGGAYPQRKVSRYLLSGLVRCGVCGQPMKGHSSSRPHHLYCYYRCFTPGCAIRSVPKGTLEELVIGKLSEALLAAEELIRSGAVTLPPDNGREAQLAAMRAELAHKEQAIGKLLEALEVALEVREIAERLRQRTQERERLQRQIGELERAAVAVPTVEDIADLRERLEVGLRENPRQAKEVIAACLEAVIVEADGQATLRYRLPVGRR
jgi:site-specific DNA recombinase